MIDYFCGVDNGGASIGLLIWHGSGDPRQQKWGENLANRSGGRTASAKVS